jgi:2-dehydro-3-deoxygluconokinase
MARVLVAGHLSATADEAPLAERLRRGTLTAGFCVSTPGDWEGLPGRAELDVMSLPDGVTSR